MRFRLIIIFILLSLNSILKADDYSDVFITGDNLIMREQSSIKSKEVTRFSKGSVVRLIKKSGKKEVINGKSGEWIEVGNSRSDSTGSNEKTGWVFDYFAAYKSDFTKVEKWDIPAFEGGLVDTEVEFKFKNNGAFEMFISYPVDFHISENRMKEIASMLKGVYDPEIKKIKMTGHLYSYRNIYWAKVDAQREGGYYFFFLNGNEIELAQFNY